MPFRQRNWRQILDFFPQRVEKLGRALSVAEHAIQVFCEANIRCHIMFQVSKLVAFKLRHRREQLDLPPWDVIVPGKDVGRVKIAELLGELGQDLPVPILAPLKNAEGDEEIPKAVVGILLAHEIPHLAVRARQARVVLVTCEGISNFHLHHHSCGAVTVCA